MRDDCISFLYHLNELAFWIIRHEIWLINSAFGRAAIQQDKEEERQSGSISFHLKKLGRSRKQFVRKKEALSLK